MQSRSSPRCWRRAGNSGVPYRSRKAASCSPKAEWDDHYGAPLIPRTYGFRASRQRLDRTSAAYRDPVLHQRVQRIQEQVIEHLLGQRLVAGQPEGSGEFLADGEPHGVKLRLAAAIA